MTSFRQRLHRHREKLHYNRWSYLSILISAIVMVFPLMQHFTFAAGRDSLTHMNRFYDAAMQIKTGHFSYFMSLYGFHQVGRIFNALYGPIWSYLNGALLLLTGSWYRWNITQSVILLFIAGFNMYQLVRYEHLGHFKSVVLAILYMISAPVMMWVYRSIFTGVGAAFTPLVILAGAKMINTREIHPWRLALLVTLLLQIHVLTTFISLLALLPCFLMACHRNPNRIHLWTKAVKTLILTILLTVNLWGSWLEVYGSNAPHLVMTYPTVDMTQHPWEVVRWTQPWFSAPSIIGPVMALFFLGITIVAVIDHGRMHRAPKFIGFFLGIGFLWLSSVLFPWHLLSDWFPIIKPMLQFPMRFLPVSYAAFFFMLGDEISHLNLKVAPESIAPTNYMISLGLLLIMGITFAGDLGIMNDKMGTFNSAVVIRGRVWQLRSTSAAQDRASFYSSNLKRALQYNPKVVPDYLPTSCPSDTYYYNHEHSYMNIVHQQLANRNLAHVHVLKHATLEAHFTASRPEKKWIPLVKYTHTQVRLNGRIVRPNISSTGIMKLPAHQGNNVVQLQYRPAGWFKVMMLISLLTWLAMLIPLGLISVKKHWRI